jgi:hypothetical protein
MNQKLLDILNNVNTLVNSNLIELNRNIDMIKKVENKLYISNTIKKEYIIFDRISMLEDIPLYGQSDKSRIKEPRKVLFLCQKIHRNREKIKN